MAIKDNLQPFWGFNVQGVTKDDGSANDAFISSLQSELDKTELDLYSSKLETYLDTSNGRWLDYWINHVLHERNTIPALTKALSDFLKINQDHIYIYEPWRDMLVWNASHYNTHKFFTDPYYRYAVIDIQIEGPYSEIVNEIVNLFRPAGVYWVVTSLVNVLNMNAPIFDLSLPATQIIESSDTDYANFTQTNSAYLNSKLDLATYVDDPFHYNKDNLNAGKQYMTSNSSYNPVVYIGSNKEEYDSTIKTTDGGVNLLKGTSDSIQVKEATGYNSGIVATNAEKLPLSLDKQYTYSVYLDNNSLGLLCNINFYDASGNYLSTQTGSYVGPKSSGYSTITFSMPSNATTVDCYPAGFPEYETTAVSVSWKDEMLEEGTIAHAWSPNPSDSGYSSWLQTKQQDELTITS